MILLREVATRNKLNSSVHESNTKQLIFLNYFLTSLHHVTIFFPSIFSISFVAVQQPAYNRGKNRKSSLRGTGPSFSLPPNTNQSEKDRRHHQTCRSAWQPTISSPSTWSCAVHYHQHTEKQALFPDFASYKAMCNMRQCS